MSDGTDKEVIDTPVAEVPDYLAMSDEDLLKLPPPSLKATTEQPKEEEEVVEESTDDATKTETDADKTDDETDGTSGKEKVDAAEIDDKQDKTDDAGAEKKPGSQAKVDEVKEEKSKDAPAVDYEAEYKRLTAPFKANGRDISVGSVDDAIALMQMGANYNKKMAALKPNLKLMKMLENNGFMSEERIGFLIDLGKKDPGAINKLVKEAGLDPMDLDGEKAKTYKPTAYAVDDREIELDTVLGDLEGSPTYTRTLDVVSNKWDVASKQAVSQSPQLLKVIDDHMASGIYDLISTEVEREKLFGRLNGLSDIESYRKVGDAIQARGGFNHLAQRQVQAKPPAKTAVIPAKPKVDEDKLKDKRRAASSTKPAPSDSLPADFNPLAMSDEDFGKLVKPKFL